MTTPAPDTLAQYAALARVLSTPCPSCGGSGLRHPADSVKNAPCPDCIEGKVWPLLQKCHEGPLPASALSRFKRWAKCSRGCNGTGLVPIYALVLGEREVPLALLWESAAKAGIRVQITYWGGVFEPAWWTGTMWHYCLATANATAAVLAALSAAQAARGAG